MNQIKVLAIARQQDGPQLEKLLACDRINCMATIEPLESNVERAAVMPVDAVVMFSRDLSEDDARFFSKLYMSRGRIAFVIICASADRSTLARAMDVGVTRLLTLEMSTDDICSGVEQEVFKVRSRRENARVQEYDSKAIAVFSTKGGSGKTTVAANLSVAMAQRGKKVALVDLDLQFGDVGVFFNVPRFDTISDLAGEQVMNSQTVDSFLYRHSSGVRLLCAPVSPELAEIVKGEHIEKIITVLRADYDYVILDLAPILDDVAITALELSDTVFFVTNPEIPTLKNTRTCMGILKALGFEKKLELVLNRDGDSFVGKNDVKKSLDMTPVLCIPYDMKASSAAVNRGIPVLLSSPRSPISKAFAAFVKKEMV